MEGQEEEKKKIKYQSGDIQNTKAINKSEYFVKVEEDKSFKAKFKKFADKIWEKRKVVVFGVLGACVVLVGVFVVIGVVGKDKNGEIEVSSEKKEMSGEVNDEEMENTSKHFAEIVKESSTDGINLDDAMRYLDDEIKNTAEDNEKKAFELILLKFSYYAAYNQPEKGVEVLKGVDERTLDDESRVRYYSALAGGALQSGDNESANEYQNKANELRDNLENSK